MARAIHERVITLDTHDDIDTQHFQASCNYTQRLTTQVNLPKMEEGGLDVAFFIVYVAQGPLTTDGYASAYKEAVAKFDAVHRLAADIAPTRIGLALKADDVTRIARSGRKVAVIGVENGYPLGTEVSRVREFWERGGRYLSLAHNGHSQLADSNTGETTGDAPNGGISPLGRQVITEMNRVGIMVDVSHLSRTAMMQAAELSRAPIIASHSAVRKLADHRRNLDDEQLRAIRKSNGVVQIVALAGYVKTEPAVRSQARDTALAEARKELGIGTGPCPLEDPKSPPFIEYERRRAALRASSPRATVKDLVDHIDYAVKLIGVDHVGISSDFDGGGGVDGWDDAADTFNVTLELVRRGYSERDIEKLWSGNLLRVWKATETVAGSLQRGTR
jgi:membrane dipeptidase